MSSIHQDDQRASAKDAIYRLLRSALWRVCDDGGRLGDKVFSEMADLFRNLPSNLQKADQGEVSYESVLAELRSQARQKGMVDWLDATMASASGSYLRDTRGTLHRLLSLVIIDLRSRIDSGEMQETFCLLDVFHNVPLQLLRVAEQGGSHEDILIWIRQRASFRGCEAWISRILLEDGGYPD